MASHRQWVREQVLQSEAEQKGLLPHYPESVSIELTSRCNLRCAHCSSHGLPELHAYHNQRDDISPELLSRIAHEVFPHITALSLVGRGEPTLVNDEIWQLCMDMVQLYNVKLSCVTNGHFIPKRFTSDVIPYLDELCVSVDGGSFETQRLNREGSDLERVISNIDYFHRQRRELNIAKRPKLSIYWTLMTNNIHELPDFIREIAQYEPDYFAIRHLVVFHEKDVTKSLLGHAELTNRYLKEAYAELDKRGIDYEAPMLMPENNDVIPVGVETPLQTCGTASLVDVSGINLGNDFERCTWMHRTGLIMSDGEVTTCGKHYGMRVGMLGEDVPFDQIWNGEQMQSLRESFGTPKMWQQCHDCWLRELKWHSQRIAKDEEQAFTNEKPNTLSIAAWDYRRYDSL